MAVETRARVTKGKAKGIDACADDRGIIRAAAMDQRGSLMRQIGQQGGQATPASLTEFKTAVTKALTPYASAILMDPEDGLPALRERSPGTGVLLAYEKSGYDADPETRMPDVLKVEVPVNMAFVQGARANTTGQVAHTKAEALRHFKEAADAATKPFIYLSAGVSDDVFRESLEWAGESGARPSGVLCGRATWLEGLPVYAKQGRAAFDAWLHDKDVRNIQMLNEVLDRVAQPWWTVYGGRPAPGP